MQEKMTSCTQSNYDYNNENDALTYSSQPITNTNLSKYRNNYGSHLDIYDRYDNSELQQLEYSTRNDDVNTVAVGAPCGGEMPEDSRYAFFVTSIAGSADFIANATHDKVDIGGGGSGYYQYCDGADDSGSMNRGFDGRHSSMGSSKMLPSVPIKHSCTMMDGMYISSYHQNDLDHHHHRQQKQQQRHGASLPTTPPLAHKKSRMLPQPGAANNPTTLGDGGYSAYGSSGVYGFLKKSMPVNGSNGDTRQNTSSLNKGSYSCDVNKSVANIGGGVGGVNGKILPTVPLRILPQPHTHKPSNHEFLTEATAAAGASELQCNFLTDVATKYDDSSSKINSMNIYVSSNFNDNTTINDYSNCLATMYSPPSYSYDAYTTSKTSVTGAAESPMPRPHTSTQPLNYKDDFNYPYNSADNVSIYSGPTIVDNTATSQLSLQQQQRKSSIIMAMTTASVIASGETRISPNLNAITEQQHKQIADRIGDTSRLTHSGSPNARDHRSLSFEYDCTGVAAPKPSYYDIITKTDNPASNAVASMVNSDKATASQISTTLTETAASASPIEPTATTLPRKLPKRLPTPYVVATKSSAVTLAAATTDASYSADTSNNYSTSYVNAINNNCNNSSNNNNNNNNNNSNGSSVNSNSVCGYNKNSNNIIKKNISVLSSELTSEMTTNSALEANSTTVLETPSILAAESSYEPYSHYEPFIFSDTITTTISSSPSCSPTLSTTAVETALFLSGDHSNSLSETCDIASSTYQPFLTNLKLGRTVEEFEKTKALKTETNNNNISTDDHISNMKLTTQLTASTVTVDYSDYLKSYTLPTFSAYMSNIDSASFSDENKIAFTSSVVASTSSLSALTTTFSSIYQLSPTTCVDTSSSPSTLLDKLSPASSSVTASIVTSTLPSLNYDTTNLLSKYDSNLTSSSLSSTYVATTTDLAKVAETVSTTAAPKFATSAESQDGSSSHLNHPLELIKITAVATPTSASNSSWSSVIRTPVPSHDVTLSTFQCSDIQSFTTTILSAEISTNSYCTPDSISTATVDYITKPQPVTVSEVTGAEKPDLSSYEEFLKNLNFDGGYMSENAYNDDLTSTLTEELATTESVKVITVTDAENAASSFGSTFMDNTSWYCAEPSTTVVTTTSLTASTAFDDNFYNSFSVDLSSLTATKQLETTAVDSLYSANTNFTYYDSYMDFDKISSTAITTAVVVSTAAETTSTGHSSYTTNSGDYYQPAVAKSSLKSIPTTTAVEASSAASKATSMLGGLSKGLKGGLDGVLSGVGGGTAITVTADATQQQQNQQQQQQQPKKGFYFGLATKLVPNVSGLLQKAQQVIPETATTTIVTGTTDSFALETNNSQQQQKHDMLTRASKEMHDSNMAPLYTSNKNDTGAYDSGSVAYYNNKNNCSNKLESQFMIQSSATPKIDQCAGASDLDDYIDNHTGHLNHADAVASADNSININSTKIVDYSTDYKYGYDEYGYSESDYIATGDIMEKSSGSFGSACSTTMAPTALDGGTLSAIATTIRPATGVVETTLATTATATTADSSGGGGGGGMTSSFLSSLTNATSQVSQHPPTAMKTISSTTGEARSAAGGMFGSFLGKAAAAVQSATQAVNQGASIASAAIQKTPQMTTTSRPTSTAEKKTVAATHFNEYEGITATATSVATAQYEDYTNCNAIPQQSDHANDFGSNYYVSSSNVQAKILPTVPPAASTGKKLPTINGKSGFLIKQQPTEIFDEDDIDLEGEDDDIIDEYTCDDEIPNYRLNSEQDDYYMDQQQMTPLSRGVNSQELEMVATNGYYKHVNSGYDYREDFFNEEDEYKYLEKEEQKAAQEAQFILHRQHQTQALLHQHQKQPPLEYIEESRDDYIDDNYPSEDSGNYLDESSSGSGGGVVAGLGVGTRDKLKDESIISASVVATAPSSGVISAAAAHQQIKKQDSLLLEEDEDQELLGMKRPVSVELGSTSGGIAAPSLSAKLADIMVDDDHLTALPQISLTQIQKKKILMRGETEEVVSGHMSHMLRKPEVTAKQRWHWAYNKIIMQLNVSNNI